MILYLDTSTPTAKICLDDECHEYETNRNLARDLLKIISEILPDFTNLTGIAVMKGPGSFTGLRIGITVANTLADQLRIPIVDATGKNWRIKSKMRLKKGENDHIVTPYYGKVPNITSPRK